MANLRSTISVTVQSVESRRKCNGCITAVKRKTAKRRRKVGGMITAAKEESAESRRKCNGHITAVKRKTDESRCKVGEIITAVKEGSAESRRNLPADVHKEPACGRRLKTPPKVANLTEHGTASGNDPFVGAPLQKRKRRTRRFLNR